MENISFKERVRRVAISYAQLYQEIFVNYEYLVLSKAYTDKDYYIIRCERDNYMHLIGVNSSLSANLFFEKCFNSTLDINDFDFIKNGQDEMMIKGYVRKKINALPEMMNMFQENLFTEERFIKNHICCSFATSNNSFTVGFTDTKKARPKTLLKGNELKNPFPVDMVLRRPRNAMLFDEVVFVNNDSACDYIDKIREIIVENLFD